MKLIIKRIGMDPRSYIDLTSSENPWPSRSTIDSRPLALFTEDGEALPCQASLIIESEPHKAPKVIVTFILDGDRVSLE